MKFVALALALLLAVGSQAASLQADAPSQLEQIRAAADVYLTQVKESTKRALDHLDGTEYAAYKAPITQRLDEMYNQIKTMQSAVSPFADNVFSTTVDATAELRGSITTDVETLKEKLKPMFEHLKDVIAKHIEEYRAQMELIISEYGKHTAEMDALKAKMDPLIEDMRAKVAANVEETKAALMPILEAVCARLIERLENLKQMATPYVEEYKDQLKQAYNQAQSISDDDISTLKTKITPLAKDIKDNFKAIFEAVAETINKQ